MQKYGGIGKEGGRYGMEDADYFPGWTGNRKITSGTLSCFRRAFDPGVDHP